MTSVTRTPCPDAPPCPTCAGRTEVVDLRRFGCRTQFYSCARWPDCTGQVWFPPPVLTVHADASIKGEHGGWAYWVAGPRGRLIDSGPTPPFVGGDANDAELYALAQGLGAALTAWGRPDGIVLLRSDSSHALTQIVEMPPRARMPAMAPLCRLIGSWVEAYGLQLHTAWLKGHRGRQTRPTYVNSMVDEMARAARLAAARST